MPRRTVVALALLMLLPAVPAGADHSDGYYEQPLWFFWDRAELDVLIVPPNHGQIYNNNGASNGLDPMEQHPLAGSYLRAVERSVADFDRAVAEYSPDFLAQGLVTNVYVVGRDAIPQAALEEPEIVIATDETKAVILGVAVKTNEEERLPCLVVNSKLFTRSMNYEDMFNINAQEYGHCLGLQHVAGDADRVNGSRYKGDMHDPMNGTYPHTPGASGTELHCVSNLNVKGLEEVFREVITGEPGWMEPSLPVSEYVRPVSTEFCRV